MNNLKYLNKKLVGLLLTGLIASTYSCSDKMEEITSINYSRNFSVLEITIDNSQQTAITLNWEKVKNATAATTYTVELSKDELFANGPEYTFQTETNSITITDEQISVRTDFYARIKANAEENKEESKWSVSKKFRITGVQYLEVIKYQDILSDQVTVRWDVSKQVTHLTINGDRVNLSASELTNGEKVITGLTPATTYDVVIYDNNADKGIRTFTTKLKVPIGTVKQLNVGDDIKLAIEGASNGDVFVLPQGSTFIASGTIAIPNGVSITIFGQEGPNKPTLKTAGTGFSLPGALGDIKFQNISFDGSSSQYIINQSNAAVLENLIFENCNINGYANTPIRLQAAGAKTIKKLVIDYCIVSNLAPSQNYAFIHTNVATGLVDNISITNSTFYNIGLGLVLHTGVGASSLLVENCTIYDVSRETRYLIDYGSQNVASTAINNVILSKTKFPTSNGIRMASTYKVSNSYQTSDYVVASGTFAGITNYSQSSTDLFVNPTNADFTIKDASFAGKSSAGDPRWR